MNYALLIGINDYLAPEIPNLNGCINDVESVHQYLLNRQTVDIPFNILTLKNQEATRSEIINSFRNHLGKAKKGEIAFFYFSGHGSREKAPIELQKLQGGDVQHESLVCYDSRIQGVFDLADKELAILINELSTKEPELVLMLDCCHSGSASRNHHQKIRNIPITKKTRPITSYLTLEDSRGNILLPRSKHLLLSACNKYEYAYEDGEQEERKGIFTQTLLSTLEENDDHISYADLNFLIGQKLKQTSYRQTPQMESHGNFDVYTHFLRPFRRDKLGPYYSLIEENGNWYINHGWIHGTPFLAINPVIFEVFMEKGDLLPIGYVQIETVHFDRCQVSWKELLQENNSQKDREYYVKLIVFPFDPIPIFLSPTEFDNPLNDEIQENLGNRIIWVTDPLIAKYQLIFSNSSWIIQYLDTDEVILKGESSALLVRMLKNLHQWERTLSLVHPKQSQAFTPTEEKRTFPIKVDTAFRILNREQELFQQNFITLDFQMAHEEISCQLETTNSSSHKLYTSLLYLSQEFGIEVLFNDWVYNSAIPYPLVRNASLFLPPQKDVLQVTDSYKFIYTREPIKDYLFNQQKLSHILQYFHSHRKLPSMRNMEIHKPIIHDWDVRTMVIRSLRELGEIGKEKLVLLNGALQFEGHAQVKAGVSLISTARHMSGPAWERSYMRVFMEELGLELVDFSTENKKLTILDLHEISGEDSLSRTPLNLKLSLELLKTAYILPFTFDGEGFHLFHVSKTPDNFLEISLDHIPPNPGDGRKPSGRSLKLSFVRLNKKGQCEHFRSLDDLKISPDQFKQVLS